MRRAGLSLRAIAATLRCSLTEIQRVLRTCVQGSPSLSDFKAPPSVIDDPLTSEDHFLVAGPRDVLASQLSGSRAVVSAVGDDDEHVPPARSAEPRQSVVATMQGRARGETDVGGSPLAYSQRRVRQIIAKLHDERPP